MTKKEWMKTIIAATVMILVWGTAPVFISFVKDSFSLVFQAFTRYALSMVLLWIVQKIRLSKEEWNKAWKTVPEIWPWILLGGVMTYIFQMFFTATYFYLPPGFANLLYQNQVVVSMLIGMFFFVDERTLLRRPSFYLGALAVFVGVFLVIHSRYGGMDVVFDYKVLFPIAAGLAWAFVGVNVKKHLSPRLPGGFSTALVFSIVAVIMFITLLFEPGPSVVGAPSTLLWVLMLGSGIAGVGVGHTMFYLVVPRLGVVVTAGLQLLLPFIAGLTAFLLLGEIIKPLQLLGGSFLLGGCFILLRLKSKKH